MAKLKNFTPDTARTKHPPLILQINRHTGEILAVFGSLSSASRLTSIPSASIHNCCTGRSKTAYNYLWKFTTPEQYHELTGEPLDPSTIQH